MRVLIVTVLILLVSRQIPGRDDPPDLTLDGVVTHADYQTYREVPFDVPEGVTRITVEFAYTGKDQRTTIDLGMRDPQRFRGWSGGNKASFSISDSDATPSYLPGPVVAGRWALLLGIPNIREGVRSEFRAKVYFERRGQLPGVSTFSESPLLKGPAWFRGDFHLHTANSDGSCRSQSGQGVPCPLFKTVEAAAARGLDFIAITDHNTTSHYNAMRELQPWFDRLLLIPGAEITTFHGHANVFGTTTQIDFRVGSPSVPDVNALLAEVKSLNALISINHPAVPSGESCMGCGWTAPEADFRNVQAVEIVNGGVVPREDPGIAFWEKLLNRGFRLTGIGGSDNHNAGAAPLGPHGAWYPVTVVQANDLSERSILSAVRAGHVVVDLDGAPDRRVEFTAEAGGAAAGMGDNLAAPRGMPAQFSVRIASAEGSRIEVIEDGRVVPLLADPSLRQHNESKRFQIQGDGARHWLRVNVRSPEGRLLMAGNPIYLNF
jgi:hypothetical protein